MEKQTIFHETAWTFLLRKEENVRYVYLIYYQWTEKLFGWSSAKWHIEKWETPEIAALRETREETGFKNLQIFDLININEYSYDVGDWYNHIKKTYWFAAVTGDITPWESNLTESELNQIKETKWHRLDDAVECLRFDDEKDLIPKIVALLQQKEIY